MAAIPAAVQLPPQITSDIATPSSLFQLTETWCKIVISILSRSVEIAHSNQRYLRPALVKLTRGANPGWGTIFTPVLRCT